MCTWNKNVNKIITKFKDNNIIVCDVNLLRKKINYRVKYLFENTTDGSLNFSKKYVMFVKWGKGFKFCIVIGQNPVKTEVYENQVFQLDATNWNILNILKKKRYSGFIMVNTFPVIDSNGKGISSIDKDNINISIFNFIVSTFSKLNIFLACTKTNFVANDFISNLKKSYPKKVKVFKIKDGKIMAHFASQAFGGRYGYGKRDELEVDVVDFKINVKSVNISNNICKVNY